MRMDDLERLAFQRETYELMDNWRPPPVLVEPPAEQVHTRELPQPVSITSKNELRPVSFDDVIGQAKVKSLLERMVETAKARDVPLDHFLLVGPAGTGKTTLALVVAAELGRKLYQLQAPISQETLLALREVLDDGDIVFGDELHLQSQGDRRGRDSTLQPEQFYQVLEDHVIPTENGLLPYPHFTFVGATTDVGQLPASFRDRFHLQPRLQPYSEDDLATIAEKNAEALGLALEDPEIARIFARAGRGTPRIINRYLRNCDSLSGSRQVTTVLAHEVVRDLNDTTDDGLDGPMRDYLVFLYTRARRVRPNGEVRYIASVNTIATNLGFSRDSKGVALYVEPELVARGFVMVGSGGRELTETGIARAEELV